ncbi:putative reverse transcriptase domain-containing protein [Tanacetum coccineum]
MPQQDRVLATVRAEIEAGNRGMDYSELETQARVVAAMAEAEAEAEAGRVRNGYDSNGSRPRPTQAVRDCSYSEFLKCKPLDFKGTEGVVGLTRWFEKIKSVFSISNCTASCQVKFATCTLQDELYQVGIPNVKYPAPEALMPCHGTDVVAYNATVLATIVDWPGCFPEDVDKIEKPDASAEHQAGKEKECDDDVNPRTIKLNNSRIRGITQASLHCPCPPRCNNCKKVGHLAKDRRSRPANDNNNNHNNKKNNQKGNGCYECGAQGHFKRNCPKLKNNDRGNQAGNDRAPVKVYVVGNAGENPDNVVAVTFLLTNRYA